VTAVAEERARIKKIIERNRPVVIGVLPTMAVNNSFNTILRAIDGTD